MAFQRFKNKIFLSGTCININLIQPTIWFKMQSTPLKTSRWKNINECPSNVIIITTNKNFHFIRYHQSLGLDLVFGGQAVL